MKQAKPSRARRPPEGSVERYDWSKAKRGRFASIQFTNVRLIDPDLEASFPDDESMNRALRAALALAQAVPKKAKAKRRKAA